MSDDSKRCVLVAGASGFVGGAVIQRFVTDGWRVIGTSRRKPLRPVSGAEFIAIDLLDPQSCHRAAADMKTVTHLFFAAVNETPDEIGSGWSSPAYIERNSRMFSNLLDPLIDLDAQLRQVMVMHGTKAYAPFHPGHLAVPLKESMSRPPNDDFYFRQEDHVRARTAGRDISWTTFRPQIIAGGGMGSNLNVLLALSVFASIRRARGHDLPIAIGAGPYAVFEMTDVELLASAVAWSADNQAARNETFNVANGDIFCWPDIMPVIADEIGLPLGEAVTGLSLRVQIDENAATWADLVRRHDLCVPADPVAYLGGSASLADVALTGDRNVITSTIKIRQAGFTDCIDTATCVIKWIRRWRESGMLPPR